MMELSRDTFYRYKEAVEVGGVKALLDKPRRKPNLKNRVDDVTEQTVLQYAIDFPAHGQTSWVHSFLQAAYAASGLGIS
jgi:hypothetical protein